MFVPPALGAERRWYEAAAAMKRLGRSDLAGSVLYSTSRPCVLCERAAADANVGQMIYGAGLRDAGKPRR